MADMKPIALAFLFLFLVVGLSFCRHWPQTVGIVAAWVWTERGIRKSGNIQHSTSNIEHPID